MRDDKWDWVDYGLHFLGGFAGTCAFLALPVLGHKPLAVGAGGLLATAGWWVFGFAREYRQHPNGDGLSAHQEREAVTWALGSACATVLCLVASWVI